MSSGQKRVEFNTRERIISDDLNTTQAFNAKERNNIARRLHNHPTQGWNQMDHPATDVLMTTLPVVDNGTVHDVYGGLMVRPDPGTTLTIDPGVAGFFVPGWPGADDSPYIIVDDLGSPLGTGLEIVPNVEATPRIDIVECRPVEAVSQSASRDVLQPDGSVANAVLVKQYTTTLEFRVRQGVANAGFPVIQQDWLPLAVIVLRAGATSYAQCDFYDVRPLVEERVNTRNSRWALTGGSYTSTNADISDRCVTPDNVSHARGWFTGEHWGYKIGGHIRRNTPSSAAHFGGAGDEEFFNALEPSNQSSAGTDLPAVTSGALNAIVAVFPRGLGRWVRYSQSPVAAAPVSGQVNPTGRLPQGPNGILILSRPQTSSPKGQCLCQGLPTTFGAGATGPNHAGIIVGWALGTGAAVNVALSNGKTHMLVLPSLSSFNANMAVSALPAGSCSITGTLSPVGNINNFDRAVNPFNIPNTAKAAILSLTYSIAFGTSTGYYSITGPSATRDGGTRFIAPESGHTTRTAITGSSVSEKVYFKQMLNGRWGSDLGGGESTDLLASILTSESMTSVTAALNLTGWEDN